MSRNLAVITRNYLACAAWADSPEDATCNVFGSLSYDNAYKDCAKFVEQAAGLTECWSDEQLGHDFWLTRNGHGTGFWDRNWKNGDKLTEIAQSFGEKYVYVSGNDELEIE